MKKRFRGSGTETAAIGERRNWTIKKARLARSATSSGTAPGLVSAFRGCFAHRAYRSVESAAPRDSYGAMHTRAKATARRQLLTSPPKNGAGTFAGGSFGQEPPSFLSPVSSCARKLQLQRWGDSPRVSGGFGAGHVGQNGTHTASSTPVTHTPALFGCGTGTFQARSLEPTPLPGGYHPVPNARRDIDTQPIRSGQGLTFAEMLAVNANANAAGGRIPGS